ncbi:MAG: MoxR family ATPase [Gammaproteobacteria bacterium]|nr:MoxR family ATPase [Gammaproteobacteria bacterium]
MSEQHTFKQLKNHITEQIIGQEQLVTRLLIALLADGHLLVEGAPGLAKTKAIKTLATGIEGQFHRVQFTPDLLPADLTGTDIYRPQDGSFTFQKGPLFHNLLLADEINRAPAKVQSALLEAMGEGQITVGSTTYPLPDLFLVMATQNPIEQEGTYPLPEAQLDRFLMHVVIDYPDIDAEKIILQLARNEALQKQSDHTSETVTEVSQHAIFAARKEVLELHLSPALEEYILQLIIATRHPEPYGSDLQQWHRFGASPRATIALDRCARAYAWLQGRDYVSPEDIQTIAHDVLRHRLILSFEAEADGITTDIFIDELLQRVPVP